MWPLGFQHARYSHHHSGTANSTTENIECPSKLLQGLLSHFLITNAHIRAAELAVQ